MPGVHVVQLMPLRLVGKKYRAATEMHLDMWFKVKPLTTSSLHSLYNPLQSKEKEINLTTNACVPL